MFCGPTIDRKKHKEIDVDEINCLGGFKQPKSKGKSEKCKKSKAPPAKPPQSSIGVSTEGTTNPCPIHAPILPAQGLLQQHRIRPNQRRKSIGKENMETIYEKNFDYEQYDEAPPRMPLAPIPENVYGYTDELPGNRRSDYGAPEGNHQKDMYCDQIYESIHGDHYAQKQRHALTSNLDLANMVHPDHQMAGQQPKIPLYQMYKGQLNVAVYMNCGLLTVHVVEGRHLNSQIRDTCDSYIVVSLVPGDVTKFCCTTDVIEDDNNPTYDEKFSFELANEDYDKRLLISCWNDDLVTGEPEFLGCMSFGVRNLHSKQVNGWYILLSEEIGQKKHLQAPDKEKTQRRHRPERVRGQENLPEQVWMDTYSIVLKKRDNGYGFTLGGWNPVKVATVEDGGAAYRAGLMEGDCVMRVNGFNVSRSSADNIARAIRTSSKYAVIEIQRARSLDCQSSSDNRSTSGVYSSMGHLSRQGSFRASDDQLTTMKPRTTALQDVGNRYGTLPKKAAKKGKTTYF